MRARVTAPSIVSFLRMSTAAFSEPPIQSAPPQSEGSSRPVEKLEVAETRKELEISGMCQACYDETDEDYECEECGVQVIAADIPENECREIAYGCLSMAFCKPCYERSWAEHPDNPAS